MRFTVRQRCGYVIGCAASLQEFHQFRAVEQQTCTQANDDATRKFTFANAGVKALLTTANDFSGAYRID